MSFLEFIAVSNCNAEGIDTENLNVIKEYGIDLSKGSIWRITSPYKVLSNHTNKFSCFLKTIFKFSKYQIGMNFNNNFNF